MLRGTAIKRLQLFIITMVCLGVTLVTPSSIAAPAKPHDWLNNDYTISSALAPNTDYQTNKLCYDATVPVAGYDEPVEGCVFSGKNYELLRGYYFMAVRFGSESQFYQVQTNDEEPVGRNWLYLVPNSDTLVYYAHMSSGSTVMLLYDNLPNRLVRTTANGHTSYSLVGTTPDFVLHDSFGAVAPVVPFSVSHSNNGRYAIVDLADGGIVRVDVLEHTQRAITGLARSFNLDYAPWETSLAATDDGKYVAVGGDYGWNIPDELRVYQLSGACGDEYVDTLSVADVCPKTSIQYDELGGFGLPLPARPTNLLYFDDNDNLTTYFDDYDTTYFHCTNSGEEDDPCTTNVGLRIRIGSTGILTSTLDYLAIGDSYTSGEGDLEKNGAYYIGGTGVNGGCHLSSRSYPFLLRSYWSVAASKMHSVACSGARVNEDYLSEMSWYTGQRSQLAGLSSSSRTQRQNSALDQFTPGVVPQLEFIRKYKPKIVTVMGGGNDLKFASIIKACATQPGACSYVSNAWDRNSLDNAIDSFYNTETKLIQTIKQLSPSSKIYVIGYPQFVKNGVCILNSGLLDSGEIAMINDSVSRLNDVLARAAQNTGVEFVSVENSLTGGRLCEGSKYMTGAVNSLLSTGNPASQSSFHPNAKGHQKMAETIKNQTSTKPPRLQKNDTYVNDFGSAILDKIAIVNYMAMTASETITQGASVQISLPPLTLLPGSLIRFFLHSDPINLGALTVGANGSLSGELTLPANTPLGNHTLVLEGHSYSGEPLTYYQYVTTTSNIPNDRDADGILDAYDNCDFIPYWFDETTGKDICATPVTSTVPSNPSSSTKSSEPTALIIPGVPGSADITNNPITDLLKNSNSNPGKSNRTTELPTWAWWAIAVGLLVLIACSLLMVYSNRKKRHE